MAILSQPGRTIFVTNNIASTGVMYGGGNTAGVLDDANGISNATTGWINSKYETTVVQLGCATLTRTGNVVFRVEGKFPTMDRPASLFATVFDAAKTRDRVFNILTRVAQIRVGVRSTVAPASPLASPCTVYAGVVFSEAAR